VTAMDVVYALKRQGRTLYGFGGWVQALFLISNKGPFQGPHLLNEERCDARSVKVNPSYPRDLCAHARAQTS
jgi:hypothetical protein